MEGVDEFFPTDGCEHAQSRASAEISMFHERKANLKQV